MKEPLGQGTITKTIADMIEDPMLVCNPRGEILFFNRAMRSFIDYSEGELLGKNLLEIIDNNYIDQMKVLMSDTSSSGEDWKEVIFRGKEKAKRLPVKLCQKEELLYLHGNEKYLEYERLRRKLDIEVKRAREIHGQALPQKLPETKHLSFASFHLPAEELGGDIFDVFKVDNGLLDDYFDQYLCFIADVSGHGLDSAMLSIFVKDTIRSFFKLKHIPGQLLSPKEILHFFVDQYLKEGYPEEYLVCLFISVFDLNTKELIYSSAGFHEPPFLIGEGKKLKELDKGGMPISSGIDRGWLNYRDTSVPLTPGTTLFMMSDGLPEQRRGEKSYDGRFKKLAGDIYFRSPEKIARGIQKDFEEFVKPGKVEDDITLVVAQYLGNAETG